MPISSLAYKFMNKYRKPFGTQVIDYMKVQRLSRSGSRFQVESKRATSCKDDDIVRSSWKHGEVMYLYEIRNTESDSVYVGVTRTSLDARF